MLIFFQNCISPHQMPYIEALSKREETDHVWVIAPRLAYNERAAMGWPTTWTKSSEKLGILIAPKDDVVNGILKQGCQTQCYCFFSGITAFPEVKHWLDLSLAFDVKRGIITEGPYVYDKPLWMHRLRFMLKDLRFVKHFDYVFAIGEDCAKYYRGWSKHWKVVPFMYCTQKLKNISEIEIPSDNRLKVCFVGVLDRRKNVSVLLKALSRIVVEDLDVTIVGDGPEKAALEKQAMTLSSNVNIMFVGSKPMDEAQQIIAANDVLVLPSLHDGWGAVINEAMALGTIPVCSDKCGAKALINKSQIGKIFRVNHPEDLARILQNYFSILEFVRRQRKIIVSWSDNNLSPISVADLIFENIQNP